MLFIGESAFFLDVIKKSMQFHIDIVDDLIDLTEKQLAHKKIFSNEYSKYSRSPYEFIWLDWSKRKNEIATQKAGCTIISGKDNKIAVTPYVQISIPDIGDIWHPGIVTLLFTIGEGAETFIHQNTKKWFENNSKPKEDFNGLVRVCEEMSIRASYVAEAFLLLINCKNISTEKSYPPEALNKKRVRQGKQPLFTYHTLVVNPVSTKHRKNGQHEPTGIKQRLHFCRGHFKEYTQDAPLFGKLTGLYWWQPMVRGNKELGIVHKDYEVKAA